MFKVLPGLFRAPTGIYQGPRRIGNWGGPYSYIRVHKPWKQSISREINEAKSEYMNMGPLNYRSSAVPVYVRMLRADHCMGSKARSLTLYGLEHLWFDITWVRKLIWEIFHIIRFQLFSTRFEISMKTVWIYQDHQPKRSRFGNLLI